MQAGPVPYGAIDRWATRNEVTDPDEFASLVACIRAMDREWLGQTTAPAPAPTDHQVASRPMTMALFDALF